MITGVGCVVLCCVLFVHMGLGDAVCKTIRRNLFLFHCVKCLTFWTTLVYTLVFTDYVLVECLAIAFVMSYVALWVDLLFAKISVWYEKWYESVVAKTSKRDTTNGDKED